MELVNTDTLKIVLRDTIDYIRIGMPHNFIYDRVARPFGLSFEYFYKNIYKEASENFKKGINLKRDYVIGLHFIRYSDKIQTLLNVDVSQYIDPRKQRIMRLLSYNQCLEFLKSKEKLIGFHSKDFKQKIKEYMPEVISKNSFTLDGLDINKLNNKEKAEFLSLLNKTKINNINKIELKESQLIIEIKEEKQIEKTKEIKYDSISQIKEKFKNKQIQRKTVHDLKQLLLQNDLDE